jgi:hypothetical protein
MRIAISSGVEERTDALQRADRRKDEFLASLAHELRSARPIRSAVEVLQIRDGKQSGRRSRTRHDRPPGRP